jgi:signal peptidase II
MGLQIPSLGIHIPGMPLYSSEPIIGNFLRFTYIQNPGMAFGIDFGWKSFFALFSIVASLAILLYLYKVRQESRIVRFSLALILGGAIGNLIDRVFYGPLFDGTALFHGRVIDFIDFDFFNIHLFGYNFSRFPVFNIADASVTVGVVMLLIFHKRTMENPHVEIAGTDPIGCDAAGDNTAGRSSSETCGQAGETGNAAKG